MSTSKIEQVHPEYADGLTAWQDMRIFYQGEDEVKASGERFLPPLASMHLDGMGRGQLGYENYKAYKARAVFPEYVAEAVESLLGMMHAKPATIQLPQALELLRENATPNSESLEMLLMRINEEQLVTGRFGIGADFATNATVTDLPKIALYYAETIRNWYEADAELQFVVLDESHWEFEPADFKWVFKKVYRYMGLVDGKYMTANFNVSNGEDFNKEKLIASIRAGTPLSTLPFVIANTKEIGASVDKPPLLGLGRKCCAIYRAEADYRQNLHMQGQDTLVTIGRIRTQNADPNSNEGEDLRTGTGARIALDTGGDAKYIGVNSQGLPEQRQALDADRKEAQAKAVAVIASSDTQSESGVAIEAKISARTVSLRQIAITSAAALQKLLRTVARWVGANPEEVVVTPNLRFVDVQVQAGDLVQLMSAKAMGAPISSESIHQWARRKGLTEKEYQDEIDLIDAEGTPPAREGAGTETIDQGDEE